jgi:hypothetical protein
MTLHTCKQASLARKGRRRSRDKYNIPSQHQPCSRQNRHVYVLKPGLLLSASDFLKQMSPHFIDLDVIAKFSGETEGVQEKYRWQAVY